MECGKLTRANARKALGVSLGDSSSVTFWKRHSSGGVNRGIPVGGEMRLETGRPCRVPEPADIRPSPQNGQHQERTLMLPMSVE